MEGEGLTLRVQQQHEAAAQRLQAARQAYLQRQALWQEVSDLSAAALPASLPAISSAQGIEPSALPPGPPSLDGHTGVLESLLAHIHILQQAEQAMAAALASPSVSGSSDLLAAAAALPAAGSDAHLCGVTPAQHLALLRQRYAQLQPHHRVLVPDVEASLAKKLGRLAAAICGSGTSASTVSESRGSGSASADSGNDAGAGGQLSLGQRLLQAVSAKQRAVAQRRAVVLAAAADLMGLAAGYLEAMRQLQGSCAEFVTGTLDSAQQGDQQATDLLQARAREQQLALAALQRRCHEAAYTADNVAALRVIDQLLAEATASVQASIKEASAQVDTYRALGPGFAALAKEYGAVQAALREVSRHLEQQRAVHRESAALRALLADSDDD